MRIYRRLLPAGALLLAAAAPLFPQAVPVQNPQGFRPHLTYFSLEHRLPAQVDPADSAILQARSRDLSYSAQFYGYDLSRGSWTWTQTVCPQLPDSILLHYTSGTPGGEDESLFTAIVPRQGGRIRIVPVYYHSAAPFRAAVESDRNYAIFNQAVPAVIAKQDSDAKGNWISLAACYVEMVGGEPNIPNEPSLATETLLAPPPTIRISMTEQTRQVLFTDRDARNQYLVWSVLLNRDGRVVSAESQSYSAYVAKITTPAPPKPAVVTYPPEPKGKITNPPEPTGKVVNPPAPH